MIKMLEDLLIEATTSPNVPGNLVAGLRKAVDAARAEAAPSSLAGKTFAFSGVLPTLSRDEACGRIEAAGGVIVSAVSAKLDYLVAGSESGSKLLKALELGVPVIGEKQLHAMLPASYKQLAAESVPPPFDSLEEAQRAEGCVPTAAASYRVCIRDSEMGKVGAVVFIGNVPDSAYPPHADWLPCDKDGWVSHVMHAVPVGVERHFDLARNMWRPLPPKPSAIDEMAEQMKRWAAPTREDFDKAIDGLSDAMGVPKRRLLGQAQEATPALAVQEGGSHYKDMKIQPAEYIHANGLGYFEGNVVKYVSRWRAKGGLQDLKKARHYLDLLTELEGDTK